jgi:hypothetical protein
MYHTITQSGSEPASARYATTRTSQIETKTKSLLASNALLELLEHVLHLLGDEVLDLGLELAKLAADLMRGAGSGALGLLELTGDLLLDLGDRGDGDGVAGGLILGCTLGLVATRLDDLSVVGRSSAVPGEDVRGVRGNVREGTDGTDGDEVSLELLGSDVSNSVGRVLGGLEREVVGQKTSNVGRGHGGTRDGVGGVLRADPGGKDVETGGEDVVALSVVGEVCTLIKEGGGAHGDGVLSGGRGVIARVCVVVTGGNGEVDAGVDGSVDGEVKSGRLATTKRHVGGRALEALLLALLGSADGIAVSLSSPLNTLHDIGHGARAVRAEHLDGVDVGLLGDTVLLASNSARAVSSVAVAILVSVSAGDGLAPVGAALEVDMLVVRAGVDDVNINTLTAVGRVEVLVPGTKAQRVAVRDTCKTPGGVLLGLIVVTTEGLDDGVTLDVVDLSEEVSGSASAGTKHLNGASRADKARLRVRLSCLIARLQPSPRKRAADLELRVVSRELGARAEAVSHSQDAVAGSFGGCWQLWRLLSAFGLCGPRGAPWLSRWLELG